MHTPSGSADSRSDCPPAPDTPPATGCWTATAAPPGGRRPTACTPPAGRSSTPCLPADRCDAAARTRLGRVLVPVHARDQPIHPVVGGGERVLAEDRPLRLIV